MAWLWSILEWMGNIDSTFFLFRWLARFANSVLRRRRSVKAGGIHFFADRAALDRSRTMSQLLQSVEEIDALLVLGQKIFHEGRNLTKFKRLLLPHPDCASLVFYSSMMKQPENPQEIRNTTDAAKRAGLFYKWCPEFVGYSLLLINKRSADARVHIEYAFPGIYGSDRASLTVWKKHFPEVFQHFESAFDVLWEQSSKPSDDEILAPVPKAPPAFAGRPPVDWILNTALGLRGIIRGRLTANQARWLGNRYDDMVRDLTTQEIEAPDLMNVDKSLLNPNQIQLLTQFQVRVREANLWIRVGNSEGRTTKKVAQSFLSRLEKLNASLDELIEKWSA